MPYRSLALRCFGCLVPSLIGTFVFFPLLGFSINTLSLFGLVLAIGLVVDDAIVVVEAVERHIHDGLSAKEATKKAMKEITGPVIFELFAKSSAVDTDFAAKLVDVAPDGFAWVVGFFASGGVFGKWEEGAFERETLSWSADGWVA